MEPVDARADRIAPAPGPLVDRDPPPPWATKGENVMRTLRARTTGVLALLSAACGTGGDSGQELRSEARDSAGVTIVENARPATGSRLGWQVAETPALSIGTLEGDEVYQLYAVEDATRLPDGRIAVANGGTSEIRFFSADGSHLESRGALGEGPGEFAQWDPEAVSTWPGDSIVGAAWWRGRIEIFDADGNHARTATLGDGYFSFLGLMPGGDILAKPSILIGMRFGAGGSTLRRQEAEFAVVTPDGEIRASLGTQPGDEWYFSPTSPAGRPHPFGRSVLATVWGRLAVVAANDRYEVRAYDGDGTLAAIVRRDHELRTPTQAELDAWFNRTYADRPEDDRTRLGALFEGMTLVEFFPAFSALHSDPPGNLWVQEYNFPEQNENIWTVFDPDGRVLGFVETPGGLDVLEIGEDYILGTTTDELGVERVQLWPLDRRAG